MRRASKRISKSVAYKTKTSSDSSDDDEPVVKLKKSKNRTNKVKDEAEDGSSSDSSVGGNFKTTDKIDSISFFENTTHVNNVENITKIETKLSDSDNSDLEDVPAEIKDETKNEVFQQIENYQKELEDAKQKMMNFNKNLSPNEQLMDVKQLLKMGETGADGSQSQGFESDEEVDSEFEEVENIVDKPSTSVPEQGVQITVEVPNSQATKSKKEVDWMAVIKRKINRVKKEYQVYIHRVHLLCWIGHGNYVNSILNSVNLLGVALSLIPSENCYPDGRITLVYLEQITKWYSKIFKVKSEPKNRTVEDILKDLPLERQLQLDMNKKEAFSRKNYVLIFICMLRAMGIQCRLVLSFRVVPLRPPQEELCSLSTKKEEVPKTKEKKEIKKLSTALKDLNKKQVIKSTSLLGSTKKSIFFEDKLKSAKKSPPPKLKIPQVDGANDVSPKVVKGRQAKKSVTEPRRSARSAIKIQLNDQDISSGEEFQDEKSTNRIPRSKSVSDVRKKTTRKTPEKMIPNEKKIVKPRSKSTPETTKKQGDKKEQLTKARSKSPSITPRKSTKKSANTSLLTVPKASDRKPKTARSKSVPKKSSKSEKPLTNEEKLLKAQGIKPRSKSTSNLKSPFFENEKNSNIPIKSRGTPKKPVINEKLKPRAAKTRKSPEPSSDASEDESEIVPRKKKKSSSDDEFDIKTKNKIKSKVNQLKKDIDRRVLSTDEEDDKKKKKVGNDFWVEVFVEEEEKWISVDVIKGQVHCVQELHSRATQPVVYVVAWNNNSTLKDVTSRYSKNWNTVTRKLRDDPVWWKQTLKSYEEKKNAREKEEDEELARQQLDQPLPTAISEYKNHPLYALKRHLLKFEAIYPPDAPTLGFVRKEPVYARECVHILHSRETWVKQARVVKPFETPYKIVKARPKYDRSTGTVTTDIPLEIFGKWQTKDYEPPVAENGIVPRNAYGNVELFKMCMLPVNTVHLRLPGLNKTAKKLRIDCAPAVVGFDFHSGSSHPTFDGFVVCEEFKNTLIEAWEQDQIETEKRAREKIEKRVYGNWRRIIKGLFIRERLKERYDFGQESGPSGTGKKKSTLKVAERKRRICSDSDSNQ